MRLGRRGSRRRRLGVGIAAVAVSAAVVSLMPSSGAGRTLDADDVISLSPATATLPIGGQYTVTATASETGGEVDDAGHTITIEVTSGPDTGQQITGQVGPTGGQLSFTFTNNGGVGTDQVRGRIDDNPDDGADPSFAFASVTWFDNTPPVVSVPADITAEATGPNGAAVNFTVTATDPDDPAGAPSCDHPSGSTFPFGTTLVTCTSTDTHGNTGSASFHITVQDTTPPALVLPADFSVEATSASGATVSYSATATDLVDGTVPVSCSPSSGTTMPLGPTTVSCSAADARGNTASGGFTVTVHDTTVPDLTVPADITVEATEHTGAVVTYAVSATDRVDPNPSVSCDPPSGSTFPVRVTPVTCTASDASGNTATKLFRVHVIDTTPPKLPLRPPVIVQTRDQSGTVVRFKVTAIDTADPDPSVQCDPASGTVFPVGETEVTCVATDASGNSSAPMSFVVDVVYSTTGGGAPPKAPPPPAPPPPPPPTGAAGNVTARPVPGKTEPQVKLPGSNTYVPLSQVKSLPPGTSVNVSGSSAIQLSDVTNKQMIFFGVADKVPSVFTIAGKVGGVVQLKLAGGNFKSCTARKFSVHEANGKPKPPVRRLWGTGKGRFSTQGKYASATVRGTEWLVADFCNGTRVTVKKGSVSVRDLVKKKTKIVSAGQTYFAGSKK